MAAIVAPPQDSAAIGAASLPAQIDLDLVRRFDTLGPRYTSYPTADRFSDQFGVADFRRAMAARAASPSGVPLSLYVHLPFCNTICFYCGCNKVVTRDTSRVGEYLRHLATEVSLQADLVGGERRVRQMHWGGGTPTFLSDAELSTVWKMLRDRFDFDPDGEYAIEIDPRSCGPETLHRLAELGFNRASFGVQDFDPDVQRAVNRVQPYDMTASVVDAARRAGFQSLNVDLIYGLPKQSVSSFTDTVERVLSLKPGRIALYSYAHLPIRFKPQRRILEPDLPSAAEKLAILARAIALFNAAGYIYIGMDHFARPEDELAEAQRNGTLTRNFQGYTVGPIEDMLSFGVSSIARVRATYSQNARDLDTYYTRLAGGELPVVRGIELTQDDLLRREVINRLMCQFALAGPSIEAAYGIDFGRYFGWELEALADFEQMGLVTISPQRLAVTPKGRFFVRAIAGTFDRYLQSAETRAAYSRII